jgi:hypothetical protein
MGSGGGERRAEVEGVIRGGRRRASPEGGWSGQNGKRREEEGGRGRKREEEGRRGEGEGVSPS